MGNPPTPYTPAIRAVLGDGEWHTWAEVYNVVESMIPPETAVAQARRRTDMQDVNIDMLIEVGKELVLSNIISQSGIERKGAKGHRRTQQFRLRPDLKDTYDQESAEEAVRAITAIPRLKEVLDNIDRSTLNPAQRFWLAIAAPLPAPTAFEEEDGDAR